MKNFRLIVAISLFAAIPTLNATTILCDGCNTADMRESAEAMAATQIPGTYTIEVLNLTGADYIAYQAIVRAGGSSGAITQQSSAKEAQVEAAAKELLRAIDAYKQTAAENIVLPTHAVYSGSTEALADKAAFAVYATHIVRTQHKKLQQHMTALNASLQHVATLIPVEYVNIVAAASNQSPKAVETGVVFPDRSEIKVQMTLQNNLVDGLVPVVTVAQ